MLRKDAYGSITYKNQNSEIIQMSLSEGMTKQTVAQPYHGTLPSSVNKNELLAPAEAEVTLPLTVLRGKKPILQGCILYDSIRYQLWGDKIIETENRRGRGKESSCSDKRQLEWLAVVELVWTVPSFFGFVENLEPCTREASI